MSPAPETPPSTSGSGSILLVIGLAIAGYVVFRIVASLTGVPC